MQTKMTHVRSQKVSHNLEPEINTLLSSKYNSDGDGWRRGGSIFFDEYPEQREKSKKITSKDKMKFGTLFSFQF